MFKEKDTLDLLEILIMVGIFIPVLISLFYKNFAPDEENYISFKYLFLTGIYMISYCITYFKRLNNVEIINKLIIINLFLVGLSTAYISIIDLISSMPMNAQNIFFKPFQTVLFFLTFAIIPISIFWWIIILSLNKAK